MQLTLQQVRKVVFRSSVAYAKAIAVGDSVQEAEVHRRRAMEDALLAEGASPAEVAPPRAEGWDG